MNIMKVNKTEYKENKQNWNQVNIGKQKCKQNLPINDPEKQPFVLYSWE